MSYSPAHPITIYRGDDSGAFGVRSIVIKVTTGLSLANATARFTLLSFTKEFTAEETATKEFTIEFSSSVTKLFPLGVIFGTLVVIDQTTGRVGQILTFADRIPFNVVLPGYCDPPLYERGVITNGTDTFTVEAAWSYESLTDLPSINGYTLKGAKTGHDLGLANLSELSQVTDAVLRDGGGTLRVTKRDGTYFDFTGSGGGGSSGPCYASSDGFMFVPAGKEEVSGTADVQIYRKQYFEQDDMSRWVLATSDHRYVRNSETGAFVDIDEPSA